MAYESLPTVAIVGAGITGLLAAQGLQKYGFKTVVFEQEPSAGARPRDWTIVIRWAIPLMMNLLPEPVMANFSKAVCNPHLSYDRDVESVPYYNGLTGDLLFKTSTPGARQITRQRLREILLNGADVRWGKRVTRISTTGNEGVDGDKGIDGDKGVRGDGVVRLEFGNGEAFGADYLFAADGSGSTVRELLLGREKARAVPSGIMFATGIAKYGDAEKTQKVADAHPVAAIMFGINVAAGCGRNYGQELTSLVMHAEDIDDMSTWTSFWVKIWKGEALRLRGQEALDYMKERAASLCDPFRSAIEFTPECNGSQCYIDEMRYWVTVPWDDMGGRVSLAGDAAHPMLPFRGQGLQNAIDDVTNYIDALLRISASRDPNLRKRVIAEFNAEVVERGSEAVRQSVQEAENALDPEKAGKLLKSRGPRSQASEEQGRMDLGAL